MPIKKLCIIKPRVLCLALSLSAIKALNGSILMLILASRIQSKEAANSRDGDVGMKSKAHEAKRAPTKK